METIIVLGALALSARVGLALYSVGLCPAKNAAGVALRALCDLCFVVLAFWCVGMAILGQDHNAVFWAAPRLLIGGSGGGSARAGELLFAYSVALLTATGLAIGVPAGRSRFLPACAQSVLLAALILPAAGRWAWGGWLAKLGFIDVGGAAALHVAAGACAAAAAVFTGPRAGKYNRDGSAAMIPGHNVPLAVVGTLATLAGWVPYVAMMALLHERRAAGASPGPEFPAAQLSSAAANVLLAAAAAGAAALVLGEVKYRKADIGLMLVGVLGGLVAVSAVAGGGGTAAAVLVGLGAGVLVPLAAVAIDLRLRIDDPVGAVAVQVVGGAWGTLVAPLLMPLPLAQRFGRLGVQALGLLAIAAVSLACSGALFASLRRLGRLRASEADEYDGLDLAEHDIAAYPDFQQNMIKSYHMREA